MKSDLWASPIQPANEKGEKNAKVTLCKRRVLDKILNISQNSQISLFNAQKRVSWYILDAQIYWIFPWTRFGYWKTSVFQGKTKLCRKEIAVLSKKYNRFIRFDVLNAPRWCTNVGSKAFAATGPKCWNRLPQFVRLTNSLSSFKSQLKTHLYAKLL